MKHKGKKPFINDGYLGLTEKDDSPSNDQSGAKNVEEEKSEKEEKTGGFIVEEEDYNDSSEYESEYNEDLYDTSKRC